MVWKKNNKTKGLLVDEKETKKKNGCPDGSETGEDDRETDYRACALRFACSWCHCDSYPFCLVIENRHQGTFLSDGDFRNVSIVLYSEIPDGETVRDFFRLFCFISGC